MAVKGVNKFEEHIEKIVLAAAAAGAVFMAYLAIQPVTIDGTDVGPKDVEPRLANELQKLTTAANQVAAQKPQVPNLQYPQEYSQLAQSSPIDDSTIHIVSAAVANFGPHNAPLTAPVIGNIIEGKVEAPDPAAPEDLTAELWEGVVADPLPLGPDGRPPATVPGQQLATHDQSAAVIEGFLPIGEMRYQMEKEALDSKTAAEKAIRDPGARIPEVYRIKVQRRERTASGWGDWTDVPATKAAPAPTTVDWKTTGGGDIPSVLQVADNEFKQIVIPDFYPDANGVPIPAPILTRQPSAQIAKETTKVQGDLQSVRVLPPPQGGAAPPATGPGVSVFPTDPKAIEALGVVPFAFWDETVAPGHVYQYQVEVDYVNPVYQSLIGLAKPALRNEPVLSPTHLDANGKPTTWWTIATPVLVNSDMAFYIHGMGLGAPGAGGSTPVTARVYKKNNGKWYWSDFNARAGEKITGQIRLVDKPGFPSMDVDTGYTIVDAELSGAGGTNVHVVLKDPGGSLVTRDSVVDKDDPNNKDLFNRAVKLQATTTSAPASQPGEIGPLGTEPWRTPVNPNRGTATRPVIPVTRPVGR